MKLKKDGSFLVPMLLSSSSAKAIEVAVYEVVVSFLCDAADTDDAASSEPVRDERVSKEANLIWSILI